LGDSGAPNTPRSDLIRTTDSAAPDAVLRNSESKTEVSPRECADPTRTAPAHSDSAPLRTCGAPSSTTISSSGSSRVPYQYYEIITYKNVLKRRYNRSQSLPNEGS